MDEERKTQREASREGHCTFMKIKLVYGDERAPPVTLEVTRTPKPGEDVVIMGGEAAQVIKVVRTPGEAQDAVVAIKKVSMT
jgi:hypothetical protein